MLTLGTFIDIALVSFLLYLFLLLLKRTHSYNILGGVVILGGIYVIAVLFKLYLTTLIFQYFIGFLIIILAVVFQRELRNFFEWIFVLGIFSRSKPRPLSEITGKEIIDSLNYLASHKIGALIAVVGKQPIDRFLEGGFLLDGRISKPLMLSIFDPSSPGHDGALIIEGNRIKRFGVHLPLAEKFQQHKDLGTRHRSGLGLSERTDALVLIVSEERGTISTAHHGTLEVCDNTEELSARIDAFLYEGVSSSNPVRDFLVHNVREKIVAVGMATLLWVIFIYRLHTY